LSSKLFFPFKETTVRPELARKICEAFGLEFNHITSIPVTTLFKKHEGTWTTGINMTFDTGAGISLLPNYLYDELSVQNYVPHQVAGISREMLVNVRISRATAKLIDLHGTSSPEFDLWVAFADRDDVPSLLGMKDVVNKVKFELNPKEKTLSLEWIS